MIKEVGEAGRTGRDHLELAGPLIDMERGAKVAGSRFAFLLGELVLLELALVRFDMDLLGEEGFTPVIPPALVREDAMYGTGFLPDTEQQLYKLADDDLYLIGTSEVPLASFHAGEILAEEELPRRYAGFSPCFRREAGAAGKDTRGIFRVHQFDKVEMFVYCEPEDAREEHERLLAIEERILQALELPYRVVNIASTTSAPRPQEVRLRGVAARPGPLPRADLDLEHDRLPGPPAGHPLPARGRQAAPRGHAQRHRVGGRPHADRAARERAERGRQRDDPRAPRAARRAGADRAVRDRLARGATPRRSSDAQMLMSPSWA